MKIEVYRTWFENESTLSKIYIDGVFFCYGLEDKIRKIGEKVWGKTAIPSGLYDVELLWWEKHSKFYPHIKSVPGFEGILIHSGVDIEDTHGCLLVGMDKKITAKKTSLLYGFKASDWMRQKVNESLKKGDKVSIEFLNHQEDIVS